MTKKVVQFIGSAIITGLLLYAVFAELHLDDFAQQVAKVNKSGVLLFACMSLLGMCLRALRYREILRDMLPESRLPSYPRFVVVTTIRNALVDMLPARLGEVSFFYVINRLGVPLLAAASTFGMCLALDIFALVLIVLVLFLLSPILFTQGALGSIPVSAESGSYWSIIGVCLFGVVVLFYLLIKLHHILEFIGELISRFAERKAIVSRKRLHTLLSKGAAMLLEIARDLRGIVENGTLFKHTCITIALRATKYGSMYVLLIAVLEQWNIGFSQVNPLITMVAFVFAEASASLPISGIMGFGAYEAASSFVFQLAKIDVPSIPAVMLIHHLISQAVAYSVGIIGLLAFLSIEVRKSNEGID